MSGNYIEYGYDRKARSWCIIVFDQNGFELKTSYVGNKDTLKYDLKCLAAEYDTKKIVKIKAY